ncbi:hypothetical protein N0V91_010984 [Didymella pomorum]|uniref:Uncharacterized protein n=1 Tax=Didymella pomorum TaxID=749634 RepID=A0A9W8YYT1_9PLEO|nr:hypothetical protein N0V91_010984 [Didymella pomorum]
MSASKPALSNNIKYYSAYRGPVHGADGKFHHFARQCDPEHEKNGYWRFATYGDDQRAHLRGFCNPEEILQAQNAGDGQYDDIFLLWVPGNLDNDNKTSIGTAAMHLKTIYNERKLLGKTLAFRGATHKIRDTKGKAARRSTFADITASTHAVNAASVAGTSSIDDNYADGSFFARHGS